VTLEVSDLRVYYRTLRGDVRALDGPTFTVADGEIMGLAGESGSGKSTLSKSLIRLDGRMRYIGGSVTLDGDEMPIWDDRAMDEFRYKRVSIIPQYAMSAMNPTRKIGKMIAELLESRGGAVPGRPRRAAPPSGAGGAGAGRAGPLPAGAVGGMKQRTVMVISTLLNPSLLIADEVTSALDVSTQRAVAETLVEFRDREFVKSMIVVTHDISLVYQIADTIMVMYGGRLAEKASAKTIIEMPKHPYTKMLLDSLPEVGVKYEDKRLSGIPGSPPGLLNPPQGCRFRDRCPLADKQCLEQPPFVEVESDHHVACWKAE